MESPSLLRCSVLGDRDLLRAALELVPIAEHQGCAAIEIWRNNCPSGFYYLSTLKQFQHTRETLADLTNFLDTYKKPRHIRGRQCRGKQIDSLLDDLAANALDDHLRIIVLPNQREVD
jgi:hypothetical protein